MPTFLQVVCAVIVANSACAAFAIGIIAATRLEKRGVGQDELPMWVYGCLVVAPLLGAAGAYVGYSLV